MDVPTQLDTQLNSLDIELAQLGGVDFTSERTILTLLGSIATIIPGIWGHWLSIPANAQAVALVAFAVIIGSHVIGKSIHHAGVESANATVKTALISTALKSSTPVLVDSAPNVSGVVDAAPTTDAAVVDNTAAVGADVPTVDAVASSVSVPTVAPVVITSP